MINIFHEMLNVKYHFLGSPGQKVPSLSCALSTEMCKERDT